MHSQAMAQQPAASQCSSSHSGSSPSRLVSSCIAPMLYASPAWLRRLSTRCKVEEFVRVIGDNGCIGTAPMCRPLAEWQQLLAADSVGSASTDGLPEVLLACADAGSAPAHPAWCASLHCQAARIHAHSQIPVGPTHMTVLDIWQHQNGI
jgi:hypothetical protein